MILFTKLLNNYLNISDELRIDMDEEKTVIKGSTIVVPVAGITRVVMNSLSYAKSLTNHVVAVYVGFDDEDIARMEKKWETDHITILIPQFITRHWWHYFLHNQTGLLLRAYLFNHKDVVIATVPYHLHK